MVKKCRHLFKPYFEKIEKSKRQIIRSSGLIFLLSHMEVTGLRNAVRKRTRDGRQSGKINFNLIDLISGIILHILDGDIRFSQFKRNPNGEFFRRLFGGELPHGSSYLWALQKCPGLARSLQRVLLRQALASLIDYCKINNKKSIIVDLDQTAREIHGKQVGVEKGYVANRRGLRCFQYRLWIFRETKMILNAELLPGSCHSAKNNLSTFKYICRVLKKAGITGVFAGDAGFQSGEVCDLIEDEGHFFIFAESQRATVKKRGKNAKNKRIHYSGKVRIKECNRPVTNKYKYKYREIFIQVLSNDGQLWFDFAADKFTNVIITNCKGSTLSIYKKYKGHAVIETVIEELKNDFGAGIAHSADFNVNATMAVCTAIAYNVKNSFIQSTKYFKRPGEIMKLSTFQNEFIQTPGMLVKNGNRKILKIGSERYEIFQKMVTAA